METCLKLIKFFSKINFNAPYIFGGDFNSHPDSDVYKFLTSHLNSINKNNEPDTIYAYHHMFGEFKGTLDYIFHSDGFEDIKRADYEELTEFMPNNKYFSDHRSIEGIFNL